jgi:hypothetical protein
VRVRVSNLIDLKPFGSSGGRDEANQTIFVARSEAVREVKRGR